LVGGPLEGRQGVVPEQVVLTTIVDTPERIAESLKIVDELTTRRGW
jgi:PII-like signaling protein